MSNGVLKIKNNTWQITVQENEKTKELYIELPTDILSQMGWDFGTELQWSQNADKSWTLAKPSTQQEEQQE